MVVPKTNLCAFIHDNIRLFIPTFILISITNLKGGNRKEIKEHDKLFYGSYVMTAACPRVLIITRAQVHQLPLCFSAPLNYQARNPYKGKKMTFVS